MKHEPRLKVVGKIDLKAKPKTARLPKAKEEEPEVVEEKPTEPVQETAESTGEPALLSWNPHQLQHRMN